MTAEMMNQEDANPMSIGAGQVANLDELVLRILQRLVQSTTRSEGSDGYADIELNEMLRRACRAAHQAGLHAEQLLILLKDAWTRVPITTRHQGRDMDAAFERLVTLSIDEFYKVE
ncbi:MAG TPA: hypothetical protein VFK04_10365 [Gemmatimonadaceae bacterium]|jgi:hypothetical protein|nr:hypothetical protein [Gemmatimonadaceae bacterium]